MPRLLFKCSSQPLYYRTFFILRKTHSSGGVFISLKNCFAKMFNENKEVRLFSYKIHVEGKTVSQEDKIEFRRAQFMTGFQ